MTERTETDQPDHPWPTLDPDDVRSLLETTDDGLTDAEAAQRLERHGPNKLEEQPPPNPLIVILRQFRSPLIYLLLVTTVVTLVLREFLDSAVIAAVLILNAAIGFTQERKAEASVRALMGLVSPKARVLREGHEHEIESEELVPGDVVLLESGDRIPADLRLYRTTQLQVDESLLTGESTPVGKSVDPVKEKAPLAERSNMAYSGAVVTRGRGRGFVVATGEDTELGAIAKEMRGEELPETPLQRRMARFGNLIAVAIGVSCALVFAIGLLIGREVTDMFMTAVALAVAAIPEGLPVVFTITLAVGVRRMARRNAIIRRLPAVETLGSTTTIGSDKTGTLTENRMTVQRIWTAETEVRVDGDELPAPEGALRKALLAGVLSNEAEISGSGDDRETLGDPTELALLVAAERFGIDPREARERHRSLAEMPFESDLRYSASVRVVDDDVLLLVKGAPERILEMSASLDGGELDPDRILKTAEDLADEGLRVLAMAYARLPGETDEVPEPEDLVFAGLVGMLDPPRDGVRESIDGCRSAGIRVVMITGDHASTARAIARDLGLAEDDSEVLSGPEVEEMDDDELAERVVDVAVYARVTPEHKLRIVRALRGHGEVVAVTGDGVNDAPALKAADIGIAMGRSGTDVAREASDMVLTDDNFVSIHAAVEQGRITFDNVRKVTFFLVSTGAAAIVAILAALGFGWPNPFLPAQLLWLNLVTNGLQDLALAFEPGEEGVLERPPRRRDEGVVSALLWERTALAGLVMAAGALWMFHTELERTGSLGEAQTVALTTMVVFMAFHAGNARSEFRSLFRISPVSNPFLLGAVITALAVHVGALYFPPTQFVLRVEPIEPAIWLRLVTVALTIIAAMELHKLLRRRAAR